ncbi:hypothetical protein [Bacillus sp. USDA818B3_A]|uniref:hypothetical protein n=1 Tax=Bacillus sp. USDA818B3_A TaxID=2698834 RepID=UPI001371A975|nr:hypothetical protein [Bacillus sp. USDA818B3_A]
MMFSKIAMFASTLFFFFGTSCFAYSNPVTSTPKFTSNQIENFHNNSTTLTLVSASNNHTNLQAADTRNTNHETENAALLMKKDQSMEPSFKNYVVPITVCLFLLIGLSSYWFVFRKKHV